MGGIRRLFETCLSCEVEQEETMRVGDETLALLRYMYHNDLSTEDILRNLCPRHSKVVTDHFDED
jgi:hypothetical protein